MNVNLNLHIIDKPQQQASLAVQGPGDRSIFWKNAETKEFR